jgi:predicted house-cleaning noncanonical NTP pyrophosphatase (MazG superfamily)
MRTFRFDKLVRDKIAPMMEAEGSVVDCYTLSNEEFAVEVAKKLEEELDELDEEVGKSRGRDLKELADVAEIYGIAFDILDHDECYDVLESAMDELEKGINMWDIEPDELLEAKEAKIEQFGGFVNRIYIRTVSVEADNRWMERYLASPNKYPEVL